MWNFYPARVQNTLKKKKIDKEKLNKSLKAPGKRNYKTLFSNVKKVTLAEINKSSLLFKEMTAEYNKLTIAENKVYRALQEKGLHLDREDFNIMEVFNHAYAEYSVASDHEENKINERPEKYSPSYFGPIDAKAKPKEIPIRVTTPQDILRAPIRINNNYENNGFEREFRLDTSGTPNSFNLEKSSKGSRKNNSHSGFNSK